MNLINLLAEYWIWIVALAVVAGILLRGRGRSRSVRPLELHNDAMPPRTPHHTASGGQRHHGCC